MIARPMLRFSSASTALADDPGAALAFFRFTRRNSSQSAMTRFICLIESSQKRAPQHG